MGKLTPHRDSLSADQEALLYKLYYEDHYTFGRDRLYKYIQANYPDSFISRRMVAQWLAKQQVHQLFTQTKTTKDIQHTVLKQPHTQIGIDLVDMQNDEFKGFKYILTCIDLFSKKAYVAALPNKEEPTVTKAMEQLIKNEIHYVTSIRSDRGTEFINDKFIKMLEKYGIKSVLSLAGKPQSNGNIERFNKTLKRLLNMSMKVLGTKDWPSVLHVIVENYNNTVHVTTNKTPNYLDEEIGNKKVLKVAENKIRKKVQSKNENNIPKFKIGDKVRRKLSPDEQGRGGENWSTELYTIYRVLKPRTPYSSTAYLIQDKDEKYDKKYYNNDLLFIPAVQNKINQPKRYTVLRLIRPVTHNKEPAYVVKWKGYGDKDNTIEPRDQLLVDVPKMVHAFEQKNSVVWKGIKYSWIPES